MKNKVLDLYLNTNKKPCKIAKKLGITLDEFYNYLLEFNYPARNNNRKWTFKAKAAVDFYIKNPETSLNELERLFHIDACSIKKALIACNVEIKNKYFIKRFNENVFDIIDTEEKAYWLGFIFADGCIASKSRKRFSNTLSFTLCLEDFNHLIKFDKFIDGDNRPKIYWYTDYKGLKKQHSCSAYSSKHLWESLYNLGCVPNKSLILKYPNIPKNLRRHFARGYFDGDGSFGIYGKYKYINLSCVGTYDVLSNLYSEINAEYSLYNHKGHKKETITLSCNTKRAKKILDYMYKDAKIYLDRKYEKYLELCRE